MRGFRPAYQQLRFTFFLCDFRGNAPTPFHHFSLRKIYPPPHPHLNSFPPHPPSPILSVSLWVLPDGVRRIDYVLAFECEANKEERDRNDAIRHKFERHLKKQGLELERTEPEESRWRFCLGFLFCFVLFCFLFYFLLLIFNLLW